jgi:hypothetical protein
MVSNKLVEEFGIEDGESAAARCYRCVKGQSRQFKMTDAWNRLPRFHIHIRGTFATGCKQ